MNVAYFVHDLNDPAVHRRVRMLHAGGARVRLLGFYRGTAPAQVEGCVPTVLGRSHDARLLRRLGATTLAACRMARLERAVRGVDTVIARQLEMLVIAARARRCHAPAASLVFECLDIHRLMLSPGWAGRALRAIEGRLLRRCHILMVSSQGFVREYFAKNHRTLPRIVLSENKVLAFDPRPDRDLRTPRPPPGPPWRIGWFGNLRCRRSLLLLAALSRRFPGTVEVVIRGRPARTAIPDFDVIVAAHPGIAFLGPYDARRDLPMIYGDVHFAWTLDFFEAGGNSEWLLPNRLYEGGFYGSVALADARVETARWLRRQQAGVLLHEPLDETLGNYFAGLDQSGYETARAAARRIPLDALLDREEECRIFVANLGHAAERQTA